MKNFIKIFVFFALTILFASSVYAQYDIPDPTPSKVPMDESTLIINSPRELCQYYDNRWERAIFIGAVGNPTENDCLYKISDGRNFGYIHGYYSGNQFCLNSYGAYFNSAGIPDKTECKTVSQKSGAQQPTPIPKLEPAPGFTKPLEKSKTQLEIEKKNKQLQQELEQAEKELTQKVQEGYQKDRAAGRIKDKETHYGTVQILRDEKITSLDSYIKANAGDIIKTGNDGFIEYSLNNSKTKFGPDTLGVTLGLNNSDKKVTTPLDWDKDPSYRPELNHWEFWENTAVDLLDFIDKNRPNYLKSCAVGDVYGCSWGTVEFIHGGVGWFNEKIEKDFKRNIVLTPTVAMVPIGTEFSVAVDQDGATTVTTLDGEVVVMDLMSRKSAIVGAYQTITIPKTNKGLTTAELQQSLTNINPNSIDKWWEKPIQKNGLDLGDNSNKIIILLSVFGFVLIIAIRRKQIWPNKSDKEENKIVTDKYKWLVDNSFATGVFSTMISLYVSFVLQSPQSTPLLKNYCLILKNYGLIFLIITILGLIFGLLGIKSPRKAFIYIGMFFNIFAIMLWFRISFMI
jgi:hypothetical protein